MVSAPTGCSRVGRSQVKPHTPDLCVPAESRVLAHRVSAHRHLPVHGFPQGALRPIGPGEGQGWPCGPGGRVGLRAGLQARRHLRPEGAGGQVAPAWAPSGRVLPSHFYIPVSPGLTRTSGTSGGATEGPSTLLSYPRCAPDPLTFLTRLPVWSPGAPDLPNHTSHPALTGTRTTDGKSATACQSLPTSEPQLY